MIQKENNKRTEKVIEYNNHDIKSMKKSHKIEKDILNFVDERLGFTNFLFNNTSFICLFICIGNNLIN